MTDQPETPTDQPDPPARKVVRVVLVDDHRMFRSGVRAELGESIEVVGEAEDVESAVRVIEEQRPDVVLLDVHLPGGGGRQVLTTLVPKLPDVRFLALSVSDAPEDVISVIRGGARGYVTKSITGQEWANASAQFVNLVTSRRLRWQDNGALSDDLAWTSRKAHDETGHFTAVRMADTHPIPAALASIRAVWLASGPAASSPRVF